MHDQLGLFKSTPEDLGRMLTRFPLEPPAPIERPAEAASKHVVEPCGPLHRLLRRRLLQPFHIEPPAVKYTSESLGKLVSTVAYYAEQVHDVAIYIVVDFNLARRLVEEKIGGSSEHLHINMVLRNQRQQCLEQIELSTDVGEEAELSQHDVGMIKLASLI